MFRFDSGKNLFQEFVPKIVVSHKIAVLRRPSDKKFILGPSQKITKTYLFYYPSDRGCLKKVSGFTFFCNFN
ncbi:hypothetical protein LEP1GSC163_2705 [Leptospira santarosai str. CBC379]|nr:hypothetical protein LEP1GSC163_2705 [Leptospira santarosai str. CBC379]